MPTLFESLQQKLSGAPATPLAPQQDSLEAALRAKSGQAAAPTGGPAASHVGEQVATDAANTQLEQQQQQGKIQGLGLQQAAETQATQAATAKTNLATNVATQEQTLATQRQTGAATTAANTTAGVQAAGFNETQKTTQLNNAADQSARQLAADKGLSLDNIWREFKASEQDLAFRKDAAEIEQTGFVLAMRDKAYLDELNRVGTERDLQDKLNYQDEMNRVVLGDHIDKLMGDMQFKQDFNATQREWDLKLASMNLDAATMFAQAAIAAQSKNEMFSGAGQLAKTGVDSYYKYGDKPADQFKDNGEGTTNSVNSSGTLQSGPGTSLDATNGGGGVPDNMS